MEIRLDSHVALITGAGRNIGRVIAEALGEAEAAVAINVKTERGEAEKLGDDCGKQRATPADPKSLERQARQLLAGKISGNQIGIWLLLPEHLRLGTWDLMLSWSGLPSDQVEPRLAMHLGNPASVGFVLSLFHRPS